jgi:DnaJ-domain-containing protein 1
MATRPLMQNGIGALEAMYAESPADVKVLRSLQGELKHRQVPRAIALLQKVEKALQAEKTQEVGANLKPKPPEPAPVTELPRLPRKPDTGQQPALWDDADAPSTSSAASSTAPAAPAPSTSAPIAPKVLVPPPEAKHTSKTETPSMSVSEAYQRLQATPGTSWETVEATRQRIVNQSHPQALAQLTEKKQVELVTEARRANLAYEVIRKERIPTF